MSLSDHHATRSADLPIPKSTLPVERRCWSRVAPLSACRLECENGHRGNELHRNVLSGLKTLGKEVSVQLEGKLRSVGLQPIPIFWSQQPNLTGLFGYDSNDLIFEPTRWPDHIARHSLIKPHARRAASRGEAGDERMQAWLRRACPRNRLVGCMVAFLQPVA